MVKKKYLVSSILLASSMFVIVNHSLKNSLNVDTPQFAIQKDALSSQEISDKDYKKQIIESSHNDKYVLQNMGSIVGPAELKDFIAKNDSNPKIYTPSESNIKNGVFDANLHIHTTNSDGQFGVVELLNQAADYAKTLKNKPFYLAITDHNTVDGLKTVVDALQNNPEKYKNIRVVLGMEVYSKLQVVPGIIKNPVDIHVLCWAINPYDEELNRVFIKKNPKNKYNYSYRTFDDAINLLKRKGLVGIAHPMRYVAYENMVATKFEYYDYLIKHYAALNQGNTLFAEGYYQSYKKAEEKELINYVNSEFAKKNIMRTGSTDSHGHSIFKMR